MYSCLLHTNTINHETACTLNKLFASKRQRCKKSKHTHTHVRHQREALVVIYYDHLIWCLAMKVGLEYVYIYIYLYIVKQQEIGCRNHRNSRPSELWERNRGQLKCDNSAFGRFTQYVLWTLTHTHIRIQITLSVEKQQQQHCECRKKRLELKLRTILISIHIRWLKAYFHS